MGFQTGFVDQKNRIAESLICNFFASPRYWLIVTLAVFWMIRVTTSNGGGDANSRQSKKTENRTFCTAFSCFSNTMASHLQETNEPITENIKKS